MAADCSFTKYFRGSELNVLKRFVDAAESVKASSVVRCNSDCPLIDPVVISKVVAQFTENKNQFDYVSNILRPTYPTGMHCEIFSFDSLREAYRNAEDPLELEHVTPYIYRRPDKFRLCNVSQDLDLSTYRWTVDYREDFDLIAKIYKALYKTNPLFDMTTIIELMHNNPDWLKINSHITKQSTV